MTDFQFKSKKRNIRHYRCSECCRVRGKKHYSENKETYIIKAATRKDEIYAMLCDYLVTHPCIDCGEKDPIVLEFDHVRGNKLMEVARMVHNGWPWHKITLEIEKCDVRCANCHRRKTAKQFDWKKFAPVV